MKADFHLSVRYVCGTLLATLLFKPWEWALSYFATDSQSVSQSLCLGLEPLCDSWLDFSCSMTIVGLMSWGVLPDGRMGLSSLCSPLLESLPLDPLESSLLDPLWSVLFWVWVICIWQSVSQSWLWALPNLCLCVDCLCVQAVSCLGLSLSLSESTLRLSNDLCFYNGLIIVSNCDIGCAGSSSIFPLLSRSLEFLVEFINQSDCTYTEYRNMGNIYLFRIKIHTLIFRYFLYATVSGPALGPTQPPIQWIRSALFPAVKQLGCESDNLPPCNAKVKNAWSYIFTLPISLHDMMLN